MTYCKLGEKPTVTYSFKKGSEHIYKSNVAPIEVEIITVNPNDVLLNQCTCERYFYGWYYSGYSTDSEGRITSFNDVLGYSPSSGSLVLSYAVWGQIKGIRVDRNGIDYKEQIQVLCRGLTAYPCQTYYSWVATYNSNYNSSFTITSARFADILKNPDGAKKCGDIDSYCEIYIKHNNQTIFQDRGLCPISFDVQCGDCPQGTLKCNAPGYPGYCCLPCNEIAGEIKAIASQVRRINNV